MYCNIMDYLTAQYYGLESIKVTDSLHSRFLEFAQFTRKAIILLFISLYYVMTSINLYRLVHENTFG